MMFFSVLTTLLISQPSSAAARIEVAPPYAPKDIVEALRTQTPIKQRYFDGERLLISGELEVELGATDVLTVSHAHEVLNGELVAGTRIQLAPDARVDFVFKTRVTRFRGPLEMKEHMRSLIASRVNADRLFASDKQHSQVLRLMATRSLIERMYLPPLEANVWTDSPEPADRESKRALVQAELDSSGTTMNVGAFLPEDLKYTQYTYVWRDLSAPSEFAAHGEPASRPTENAIVASEGPRPNTPEHFLELFIDYLKARVADTCEPNLTVDEAKD